ncbi:MAG: hypothetical protein AABZ47_05655 [Planctomycetota bacterium]
MQSLRNIFACIGLVLFLATEVQAVAFKVHNQSTQKFRMRVNDRGSWREWVEMPPGFWDVTAPKVTREDHEVEIDVFTSNTRRPKPEWVSFYRGRHGSRAFTRVLHLFEYVDVGKQKAIFMTWHDEPPGCRGKPVFENGQFKNGCLVKSGWSDDLLKQAAKKIAETAIYQVVGGG